jgi:hypothetical protein
MPDKKRGSVTMPRPLAAFMGLAGLVSAIIAIAAGPNWLIGGFAGAVAVLAIPPLRRGVLRWPADARVCVIAGVIVAVGVVGGGQVGGSSGQKTVRSPKADLAATGYKHGEWFEQEAEKPVETFRTPGLATSTTGHLIRASQVVQVLCRRYVPGVPSAHPEGYWYRIGRKPWNGKAYAPANAFWNGVNIVSGPGVKYTDLRVPTCE